eukprot:364973-Chlamydomonas_euryale.AAC.11
MLLHGSCARVLSRGGREVRGEERDCSRISIGRGGGSVGFTLLTTRTPMHPQCCCSRWMRAARPILARTQPACPS